jgi:hypothetical protein
VHANEWVESELEGIDKQENERLHRRVQKIRHITSLLVSLALIAAIAGVFGSGPAIRRVRGDPPGIIVEYPSVMRMNAQADLVVHIPAADSRITEVAFREDYTRAFELIMVPNPVQSGSGKGQTIYHFERIPGEPATILFRMKPVTFGRLTTEISTPQGSSVQLDQLVLP